MMRLFCDQCEGLIVEVTTSSVPFLPEWTYNYHGWKRQFCGEACWKRAVISHLSHAELFNAFQALMKEAVA